MSDSLATHRLKIRVRYPEADPMGYLHHSTYLQYFEMGRIELLREQGHSYADLERAGVFFVVARIEVRYKSPARFDDELELITKLVKQTAVRFDHAYVVMKGDVVIAQATSTIACVGSDGSVREIPDELKARS